MNTIEHQCKFVYDLGRLYAFAESRGKVITSGEAFRSPEQCWIHSLPARSLLYAVTPDGTTIHYWVEVGGRGIKTSNHGRRLAKDLNVILFDDDGRSRLAETVEDYRELGEHWESLDPLNRWGGHFVHVSPDADHFERNAP